MISEQNRLTSLIGERCYTLNHSGTKKEELIIASEPFIMNNMAKVAVIKFDNSLDTINLSSLVLINNFT